MSEVQTLRGAIDSSALGRVLIHEHIFLMDMEYTYNYRQDFFEDKTITDAAARRTSGCRCASSPIARRSPGVRRCA